MTERTDRTTPKNDRPQSASPHDRKISDRGACKAYLAKITSYFHLKHSEVHSKALPEYTKSLSVRPPQSSHDCVLRPAIEPLTHTKHHHAGRTLLCYVGAVGLQ